MSLDLVTAATEDGYTDVVDLDVAKLQCRIDGTTEDVFLTNQLIPAAFDRAELATRRQLLATTWRLVLDRFPACGWIEIPKPPLIEVVSLTYLDTAGVSQTWGSSNYVVDRPQGPRCRRGRIALADGVIWPATRSQINAITVTFRAGYVDDIAAAAADQVPNVPSLLVQGLLMDIGTMYENRENFVIGTIVADLPGRSADIYRSFKSFPTQGPW